VIHFLFPPILVIGEIFAYFCFFGKKQIKKRREGCFLWAINQIAVGNKSNCCGQYRDCHPAGGHPEGETFNFFYINPEQKLLRNF
jgi:hypothetical protein